MSEYDDESNGYEEESQERSAPGSSDYNEVSQSDQADPEYDGSGDENYEGEYENGMQHQQQQAGPSRKFYFDAKIAAFNQEPEVEYEEELVEEDDDEAEGDDPRDADFEDNNLSQQDEDDDEYNASEPEEDVVKEEAFEDSDDGFINPRKRQAVKVIPPRVASISRKRQKRAVQKKDEFLSDDDLSEQEQKTTAVRVPRTVVNFANTDFSSRETRSRRFPRKSYVEEESEEEEDEKAKAKAAAGEEPAEEEDTDKIERVLWHQLMGTADERLSQNQKPEPFILDTDPSAELNWDEQEFYIKWKGQSYLHCEWQSLMNLQQLSGYKKVINYMKKVDDDRQKRRSLSGEEAESHDLSKEMELDLLKQYTQVERVFADRTSTVDGEELQEYLVKWSGLSYAESTWERDVDLAFAQTSIDEYKEREAATSIQGKPVDQQRKKANATLRFFAQQPDYLKGGQLRDYQIEGLNFLVYSWMKNTNVILADEMGLGKTVQSLSMLGFLQYTMEITGPFLVVVPLSTIANWAKELKKWVPGMNVVVYVGNRASREVCRNYEFYSGRRAKFNTLVTTYEVLNNDKAILSQFRWDFLMVDEAHRLKNSEAQLYTNLMEFSAKNKVLVTGTPLQNSVEELWALLHFLDPVKFRNKEDFAARYKNLTDMVDSGLEKLHDDLRPHLLRRVIKDVEKSLPPKIERILRVEMSPLQKQYYKWILEKNFQDLNKNARRNQVSLLNTVVELKKCCNHPFLFESADFGYGGSAGNDKSKVQRVILSSGKLVLLDKLLIRLRETGHRVLIFSQMVKMLDILADYLRLRGFQFQRLDGSTKHQTRQQAMEHFNDKEKGDFCFLLSTRAGGLGINLATADTVIIFDSDWNPQNDLQAMSRAHRIGQQEVVNVYRFVTSKSVEEDILERAKKKMVLDHLVIQKLNAQGRLEMKKTKEQSMFDKNELMAILRFGAEELFKEEKKDESKLENMDIDEILERAEKVTGDGEQGAANDLLGGFKVANFSHTDDVAFWSRLIPTTNKESAKEQDLGPRSTRKSRTYTEEVSADRYNRRRRVVEENTRKRPTRMSRAPEPLPRADGATAHVADWQGRSLGKKDANAFVKAVKKFGADKSRIAIIAENAGAFMGDASAAAQLELLDALIEGCTEAVDNCDNPKAAVLSFFGSSVKAQELLTRVKELSLLGKRIRRHQDPVAQFRLRSHPKMASWSKSCGWNQVDDARLLLGLYFHGYGNWEKVRNDDRLGLTKKIAPAGVTATSLPKATHLDARASALLRKEMELDKGANGKEKARSKRKQVDEGPSRYAKDRVSNSKPTGTRKSARNINRENAALAAAREAEDKEEGEISDDESIQQPRKEKVDDKDREQRWNTWCENVLASESRTLRRLQDLKESKSGISNEKVVVKVKKYLQKLGQKVDQTLDENPDAKCGREKMSQHLWNYVSKFSDLPGAGLAEIYQKLKECEPEEATAAAAQANNGGMSTKRTGEQLTYKRRRRTSNDAEPSKKRRKGGDDD